MKYTPIEYNAKSSPRRRASVVS